MFFDQNKITSTAFQDFKLKTVLNTSYNYEYSSKEAIPLQFGSKNRPY